MVRPRHAPKQGGGGHNSSLQGAKLRLVVENSEQNSLEIVRVTTSQLSAIPGPSRSFPRYNDDVPFTVRDFQPADFETLWRLDRECFPPGISYSRAELKAYMRRNRSFTLVAVADAPSCAIVSDSGRSTKHSPATGTADIAGFIVAEADGRAHGHIITIDVIASARRSGAGSLLLRSAEDRLRAVHCSSIVLETAVDNVSALSFYKRHAYSVIRTFPRYYSNGVDALVLQKNLAAAP